MRTTPAGTPTHTSLASPRARIPEVIVDPDTQNLGLQPYLGVASHYNRGPDCIDGAFFTGSFYSDQAAAFFAGNHYRGPIREEIQLSASGQAYIAIRLTLCAYMLRALLSSGDNPPHSRAVLASDTGNLTSYGGETRRGESVIITELAQVQAAGTIEMAYGEDRHVGKALGITLESGHYLTPDLQAGALDQNIYLARLVKTWNVLHGDVCQLLGAVLKNYQGVALGHMNQELADELLDLEDPSFDPSRVSSGRGVFAPLGRPLYQRDQTFELEAESATVDAEEKGEFVLRRAPRRRRGLFGLPDRAPEAEAQSVLASPLAGQACRSPEAQFVLASPLGGRVPRSPIARMSRGAPFSPLRRRLTLTPGSSPQSRL